jgi:hypothetical protein
MWEKGKRIWQAKDTLGMTPEEEALGKEVADKTAKQMEYPWQLVSC